MKDFKSNKLIKDITIGASRGLAARGDPLNQVVNKSLKIANNL